ncbi:MAG: serine/threonine protein kinase [Gemmatimonadales bacterium]|nr:MAG: serine/threonine protein kinase [Gemmatimonadales bacterium]
MNDDPESQTVSGLESREAIRALTEALGDEYDIKRELGKGTMARVFLARNRALGRLVAIKVLLPGRAADETARKRFEREARASASLSHPNVVDVYRFGRLPDETPYLVMRFVKGRTLEERLAAEGPMGSEEARRVLGQVAQGLAAAHARGIVHRDLRPGNILWDEEREQALLSDFGIAAILETSGEDVARLTLDGQILGTPRYQAPEQLLEQEVTEQADIFAFGITGYELLSTEAPWGAVDGARLIAARLRQDPRSLSDLLPSVDSGLSDLLLRCLARNPAHRPTSRDLVRILTHAEVGERPASVDGPSAAPADLTDILKRRVPQVVLLTLGVAWGLMTLMDQLVSREILPDVSYRLTLGFAVAGVAASSVVAWFHGEKGTQKAPLIEYLILGGIAALWVAFSLWMLPG